MLNWIVLGIVLFCCIEWWRLRSKADYDGKAFKAIAAWMERQEKINQEFRKALERGEKKEG